MDTTEETSVAAWGEQIFDAAPTGLMLVDEKGLIARANSELCIMFGYANGALTGRTVQTLLPERYRGGHPALLRGYQQCPEKRPMGAGRDLFGQRQDGREFPVEIGLNPIETESGKMVLASITDITQRKNAEYRLQQANTNLQEFASVASHDLRAPLRGIANIIEWINEDLGETKAPAIIEHIEHGATCVKRMERLITDLLNYARAGEASASVTVIDINSMVDEILELVGENCSFAFEKDIRIERITACRTPIETCIRNLVSNAIKHHDRTDGLIAISCFEKNGFCIFQVTDDGPGIPHNAHERIFRLFQSLNKFREGSTGLGLAITKRLVESHGGCISVHSNENKRGTMFQFRWPMDHRHDLTRV